MKNTAEKTISEIVADDYRAAQVFKNHSIDFCCKGNRSVGEACEEKNIDANKLLEEIEQVKQNKPSSTTDFKKWPLDLLADYIEKTHHRYVEEKLPILKQYLHKLCQVHGDRHPELFEISEEFNMSAGELAAHMKKEEFILFPYIRKMAKSKESKTTLDAPNFGTVQNPVQMMMDEHTTEGDRFEKISKLSNKYTPPADGCNTYRVTYALLNEFEEDLHLHIHLENNILFPKAIEMEKELSPQTQDQ
ncbi:MAG TPA: iron-sulfur cluster repair di-iron protein [Cyclobacteriaceae bacterium]|nr:iron-sulfur cluster repair di-iron protein [Cyclobacteriaceae bacterium]HNP07804.1 iron-sulfur cluster repair di-iron protein [Cyclobacteriaceae bacterium]HRK55217.1 iron-sulfur cluster repair di-iron protein [Cyclobacteriaceae bacterium]